MKTTTCLLLLCLASACGWRLPPPGERVHDGAALDDAQASDDAAADAPTDTQPTADAAGDAVVVVLDDPTDASVVDAADPSDAADPPDVPAAPDVPPPVDAGPPLGYACESAIAVNIGGTVHASTCGVPFGPTACGSGAGPYFVFANTGASTVGVRLAATRDATGAEAPLVTVPGPCPGDPSAPVVCWDTGDEILTVPAGRTLLIRVLEQADCDALTLRVTAP
jgi:hypothetical protein